MFLPSGARGGVDETKPVGGSSLVTYRGQGWRRTYRGLSADPIEFLSEVARECGGFARVDLFPYRFHLVNDPDLIREALVEKPDVLIIKGGVSGGLARLIGRGILTNHGDQWRTSRQTLQPLFHRQAFEAYLPIMLDRMRESLNRWQSRFAGQSVSMNREMLALSFRMMCSTLFGWTPGFDEAEAFADAVWILQRDGMARYTRGGDAMPWIPTPRNRRVNAARTALIRLADRAIFEGSNQPRDEILSLLFAGTESPANTVCWALQLLDEHPEWRRKVTALVAGWNPQTLHERVDDSDELSQVISETLRLYPAGWAFERFAAEDTTLGGETIRKGSRLLFSPYLLHRNRRYWPDPDVFNPLRFAPGSFAPTGVPKYAYLPFGAGPRSCIGSRLAWVEMRISLGLLLKECQWRTEPRVDDPPLRAEGSFKIRLNRPLRMRLDRAL